MCGELFASSGGVKGDSRIAPGGHGVREEDIAVSDPHR